ncbi:hypothetical protein LMG28614_03278 [Paraburkholderia ultramafica]|uniref:Calcium/calmodulin-dependent protein kinase II association-domain domain-containing protein n=1 Tax=Paraburkholderia ultramafica TaxID=1544867 RepID=A0A6S7B937_9BURK|nr:SgcJ/EcaC family oxidoreductase [Paraburkholderia ultramafica]CAB3791293.1 hypothetical protein LMG28614_03278 [Paraburkholderia ultramafica]
MKKILIAAAFVFSSVAFANDVQVPKVYHEIATAPAAPRESEIASLFDRWNAALATGDADTVTKLYAPNAVLEPTVSNEVRTTTDGIRDYFVKFLKMKPQGTINVREIRLLGDSAALDTGVYTFDLIKNGTHQKVQARYTYVYQKVDGNWKILNHHSSMMPQ